MRLDVFLHVGTLISIAVFYFSRLVSMVRSKEWTYCAKILVSALPAVAGYFCFDDFVESMFADIKTVGVLLIFTGVVLVGTRFIPRRKKDVSFMRALVMGLGQALALLPGVSSSGMTLASARAGGVDPEKSAEFSFLMSAPLLAGAAMLEVVKSFGETNSVADVSWGMAIYGCLVAAAVGYFSLKLLVMTLKGKWFWLFGPYCILAGLFVLICVRFKWLTAAS
jgi:undecaprenyl-diphosphatase